MFEYLFTILVNSIRSTARLFNYELKIVLTEHKIKTEFESPDNPNTAWDSEHWVYGNLFLKGIANPIKAKKSEVKDGDFEIITSERYKTYMEQTLIDDMLQAAKSDGLTLKSVALMLGALNILAVGLVFILTNGGI